MVGFRRWQLGSLVALSRRYSCFEQSAIADVEPCPRATTGVSGATLVVAVLWLGAQRELDRIVTQLRDSQIKARSLLRVGAPFLEIIHAAQAENVDLIVLGTHGRTGLAHVLLGSVAERVVQKAGCAVLTVRHPDRRFKHPLDK